MPTAGDRLRDLTAATIPGNDAFSYIVDDVGDKKANKAAMQKWLQVYNAPEISRSPLIRVNDPNGYQLNFTHDVTVSVRASNQPDGSSPITTSEVVHPSVLHFPGQWRGWKWWMCITPYPGSDATYENPSILVSHDGLAWTEPTGIQNPIAPYPASSTSQGDVFLAYDPELDILVVTYVRTSATANELRMITSSDGITWSAPTVVLTHPTIVLGSPALVRYITSAGVIRWRLYYNKADGSGYYGPHFVESSSSSGSTEPWNLSAITLCTINGLGTGRTGWDFQMYNLPGGQWLYVPTVTYGGGGAGTRPVIGTSDNGITFECGKPIVRRTNSGSIGFTGLIYTTSFVPSFSGRVAFRAFTTGTVTGLGWRLKIGDVVPRTTGLLVGSQKIFEFNHKYNLAPASGVLTSVSGFTPEGVVATTTHGGSTKASRGTTGITFSAIDQYFLWSGSNWTAPTAFTAICRFRPLGDPTTATGKQTVFIVGTLMVQIRPVAGVWQLWVMQVAETSVIVPQLIVPYTGLFTIAVSWDGTIARFGSSLTHDYGAAQDGALTSMTNTAQIWIGAGDNSGAPGGILVDKFLLFDRATTENLEGLATSFDY